MISVQLIIYSPAGDERETLPFSGETLEEAVVAAAEAGYARRCDFRVVEVEAHFALYWIGRVGQAPDNLEAAVRTRLEKLRRR